MYASADILIFGHDAMLLETRCLVLKTAGFRAWSASTASAATEMMVMLPIDLFVLCQTLSSEECESALLAAHTLRPNMKNLVLATHSLSKPTDQHDTILNVFLDPKGLIAMIRDKIDVEAAALTKH